MEKIKILNKLLSVVVLIYLIKNYNEIKSRFYEPVNEVRAKGTFTFSKGNPDQLVFRVALAEGRMLKIEGQPYKDYVLLVPTVVLKRVK